MNLFVTKLAGVFSQSLAHSARIVGQCWLCDQPAQYYCGCCQVCFADLPRPPPRNLRPATSPDYCHTWLAALYYQAPVEGWVKRFKFHAQPMLMRPFATLIAAQVVAYHKQQRCALPDYIVAVPMSFQRWQKRGYNQAQLLAEQLSTLLGIPLGNVLETNRQRAQQHQLSKASRMVNMEGAYRVNQPVATAHWALVDDIITTGATLNSAALALTEAGAEQVSGWALAYTPAANDTL